MLSKVDRWENQIQITLDGFIEEMIMDGLNAKEIEDAIKTAARYATDDLEGVVTAWQEEKEAMRSFFAEGEDNV